MKTISTGISNTGQRTLIVEEDIEVPGIGTFTKRNEVSAVEMTWEDYARSIHQGAGFASQADERAMRESWQWWQAVVCAAKKAHLI